MTQAEEHVTAKLSEPWPGLGPLRPCAGCVLGIPLSSEAGRVPHFGQSWLG